MAADDKQIAGDHYKKLDPEPWNVIIKWNLGYLEGTALKYIARWRDKGGIDDIKKAIHFLEKLVELNTPVSNNLPSSEGTKYGNGVTGTMGGLRLTSKEPSPHWGTIDSPMGRNTMTEGLKDYHNARDV